MNYESHRTSQYGGFAPATPGFTAFGPEWIFNGAASAAPAILAAESALGSHPCVGRGRDADHSAPPAQIPTCEFPA